MFLFTGMVSLLHHGHVITTILNLSASAIYAFLFFLTWKQRRTSQKAFNGFKALITDGQEHDDKTFKAWYSTTDQAFKEKALELLKQYRPSAANLIQSEIDHFDQLIEEDRQRPKRTVTINSNK